MIFVEVAAEVFAEVFAEGGFDEGQIGVEGAGGEADAQELAAAGNDVVFKPLAIEHGDDAVAVGLEGDCVATFADFGDVVLQGVAGIGEDQAGVIEAIAAHHAAGGIRQQFLDRVLAEANPEFVFSEIAAVAVGGIHREGDLLDRHFGSEFLLEAVGVDEEAVVLLLQALHLGDGLFVVGNPGGIAGFDGGGGIGGSCQEGEGLEVPGAFVGIPVGAGDSCCDRNCRGYPR